MNEFFNKVTLPHNPLKDTYDIFKQDVSLVRIDKSYLNPLLSDTLYRLGITVQFIECFYKKPGSAGSIHTDLEGGNFVKINWIYTEGRSYMEWFELKPNNRPVSRLHNVSGTSYTEYSILDVIPRDKADIKGSYLVQVGVPHRVINFTHDRYCLSLVLADFDNNRLTMYQAQELLKDYIT